MASRSKLTPVSQSVAWDRTGTAPSLSPILVTVIEDQEILFVQYSFNFESTSASWLVAPGVVGSYLDFSGSSAELPLALQNLDLLPAGSYKVNIIIELSNSDSYQKTMTAVVNLTLTGSAVGAITTDQTNYDLVYVRSTNSLSGDTAVTILNNDANADIEFSTIGTLFKESIITTNLLLEEDPAAPLATNPDLPLSGLKVVNCRLKKDGNYIYNFTVTIAVIENEEIITDPNFLDFKLRKGYNETQTLDLQIINPLNKDFTITGPDWLNFSVPLGNSSMTISVTTDNSETVSVGAFAGNIEIAYEGKTLLVPVTLLVVEFISIPDRDFCLDDIILTANRQDDAGQILRIRMTAKFHTNEKQFENTISYNVMYQKGIAKTDIGTKVHRMFPRNRKSSFLAPKTKPFENLFVYKPAEIILTIEELDINYGIKKTVTLPSLFLYPGKKPKMFPLFTNHNIRRRVDQSAYIFSYLADQVNPIDIVGRVVASNPVLPGEVFTVKIEDNDGLIPWTNFKTILGVDFYKLKQREPIQVEWQNQNHTPEWFSFTGDFTRTKDKTQIYQENSFTLNNEKFDVRNAQGAKINTGFILKAEATLIDELIDSKLCFLTIKDKVYQGFAVSSKLIEEDSALQLYQYEVEFLINGEI